MFRQYNIIDFEIFIINYAHTDTRFLFVFSIYSKI